MLSNIDRIIIINANKYKIIENYIIFERYELDWSIFFIK